MSKYPALLSKNLKAKGWANSCSAFKITLLVNILITSQSGGKTSKIIKFLNTKNTYKILNKVSILSVIALNKPLIKSLLKVSCRNLAPSALPISVYNETRPIVVKYQSNKPPNNPENTHFSTNFNYHTHRKITKSLESLSMILSTVWIRTSKIDKFNVSTSWWMQLLIFPCSSFVFFCLNKKPNISPIISVQSFNSSRRIKWNRRCLHAFTNKILRDSEK